MSEPRILLGEDALLRQLPELLRRQRHRCTLLAAGPHFINSAAGQALRAALADTLAAVKAAPAGLLQVDAVRADAEALPAGIDSVVAVGGGRSIDYAKALLYYSKMNPVLFAAVPTTAGSGSDATAFAVVYQGLEKISLAHPALLPNVVVWAESLLEGLPQRQRAVSGLDALVQCLESLWSRTATVASRAWAWEAGNWLYRHLPAFVAAPTPELTLGALYAAHYSGRAINISRTTGPHALSYYLTAAHGIDHGHAVGLLLPVFLQYNENAGGSGYESVLELLGAHTGAEASARWQAYLSDLGLSARLTGQGLSALVIPEWLQHINAERFANNPEPLDTARLGELLHQTLFS